MADDKSAMEVRKVLCALPDNDTFELLRVLLSERCGCYRLEQVCLAAAVLEAARTGNYDIYIIDNWWLADADGLKICRKLCQEDPILSKLKHASAKRLIQYWNCLFWYAVMASPARSGASCGGEQHRKWLIYHH